MFDNEDYEIEEMIGMLVEAGAMKVHGMMKNGEITYTMVPEVLKEVLPELYDIFMAEVNETLLELIDFGFVNVEYDENLVPKFLITEEGKQALNDMGFINE